MEDENKESKDLELIKCPPELVFEPLCLEFADAARPKVTFANKVATDKVPTQLINLIPESKCMQIFNVKDATREEEVNIYRLPF
jgi:hypothetical protein